MITINEILDPIVLLIDYSDRLTDAILLQDTDHSRDNNFTKYTSYQDQEILDILVPALTLIQETKLIQYKHNQQMTPLNLKYTCTTLQKWQML